MIIVLHSDHCTSQCHNTLQWSHLSAQIRCEYIEFCPGAQIGSGLYWTAISLSCPWSIIAESRIGHSKTHFSAINSESLRGNVGPSKYYVIVSKAVPHLFCVSPVNLWYFSCSVFLPSSAALCFPSRACWWAVPPCDAMYLLYFFYFSFLHWIPIQIHMKIQIQLQIELKPRVWRCYV